MNKQASTSGKQPSRGGQTAASTSGKRASRSDQTAATSTAVVGQQQQRRHRVARRNTAGPTSSSHHEKITCPEDLKKEILKEYVSAKKQYDKYVATDGYDYFNLDDAMPQKVEEFCPLPPFPQGKGEVVKLSDDEGNVPEVRAIILEKCPEVPQMTHWVNINKNIIGRDELQLHSFPYLSDDHVAIDQELNKRLTELFPEGIHGADVGCEKEMNDWLLYHVATPILKRHKWESPEDMELFMKRMQTLFPLKGSSKTFMKSYRLSKLRYDSENVPVSRPRIFGEDGRFTAHHTPEAVQHTFKNLLCKKCYSFDCIQHPYGEDDVHIEQYDDDSDEEESSDDEETCGEHCYKNGDESQESGEWNNQEKTWFDMLQAAGITSSCEISMLFCNAYGGCYRTCKQVHAYKISKEPLSRRSFDTNRIEGNKLQPITSKQREAFRRAHDGKFNNSRLYESCKHSGPCAVENDCSCKLADIVCTKFCGCPTTCESRFPGWECDPDLCQSCNCVVGDNPICKNINIQRSLIRKLYVDHSTVAQSGCFTQNLIPMGGYIGEYNGEIISSDEGERRGVIADIRKTSYLFKLNEEQCIDAENYGSVLRFINHSKNPNCRPKILVVNGQHRIAFFALRDIQPGEELFFNYSYSRVNVEQYEMKEAPQQ